MSWKMNRMICGWKKKAKNFQRKGYGQNPSLYFLSLRLYSTVKVTEMRGQSDRNIRKLRDTYTRKLQHQLYEHLLQKKSLTLREIEFVSLYAVSLEQDGKNTAKVKRENKTPPRKKSGLTEPEN